MAIIIVFPISVLLDSKLESVCLHVTRQLAEACGRDDPNFKQKNVFTFYYHII